MTGQVPHRLDARVLRITGVCALARTMAALDITVVAVAQRTFIERFGSGQAMVAWTMTGYTLALATMIPLAGWAADRFGTKRLFMVAVLLFTGGSVLCATASNITALIAFRMLEGLGGGLLLPLNHAIMTREAGPHRLGRLLGASGVPIMLAPIFGPVLGGWLIGSFGWPWIFLINVPVGIIAVVLAGAVFPPDPPSTREPFDFVGMALLSPGLAGFLYGVSSIPGRNTVTDVHVWLPAGAGLALVAGFVVHALTGTDHPLIDLRLFTIGAVALSNAALLLFEAALLGAVLLFPSCLQQLLGQTPLQSGVLLIPHGVAAMLTMPIAGYLMDRRGPVPVVLTGVTLAASGMAFFAYAVFRQLGYLPALAGGLVVMGLGVGCISTPLSTAAMRVLSPGQIARGATLLNVNIQLAASVGAALMSAILNSRFNLSSHITAGPVDRSAAMHDLSHAYAVVFAVAAAMLALTYIPVVLLAKIPADHRGSDQITH